MKFSESRPVLPGIGLGQTLAVFGGAAALLFVMTHGLIPLLSRTTGQEVVLWWFVVGGFGVFLPLLLVAGVLLHTEGAGWGRQLWGERLRFRPMNGGDWCWGIAGLLLIGALSAAVSALLRGIVGHVDPQPPFLHVTPLTPDRLWLLAAWLPFWVLNIMSEEILWRGVILPRQEQRFGQWAWTVNAGGWLVFHPAFGWQIMLTVLPLVCILPYVVQRRQNTWIGVLLHAALNGPAFLAIAFGLL